MTSSSGRPGNCIRCGCANGNHSFGRCKGKDKKGSTWEACDFEWVRCTTRGHSSNVQFIDCFRCWKHPGAPPKHLWGTQPDDDLGVPTADELDIPWPEAETTKSAASTRGRTLSQDSIDELQWSPGRYNREGESSTLVQDLSNLQMKHTAVSSNESIYVETSVSKHGRICFENSEGRKVKTDESEWDPSTVDYAGEMADCFLYISPHSQRQYYTWELKASRSKGKDKGDKGKGNRKR